MKKIAAAVLGGLFITVSAAGTGFAVTKCPSEGGAWQYGINKNYNAAYSNYVNHSPKHSTAVLGNNGLKRSKCAGKNKWAKVMAPRKTKGNKYYYYNKC